MKPEDSLRPLQNEIFLRPPNGRADLRGLRSQEVLEKRYPLRQYLLA